MSDATKAEIDELCLLWGHMIKTANAKGLAEMYTVDCNVFPPGVPPLIGQDAWQKHVEGVCARGCTGAKLTAVTIKPDADATPEGGVVYERGNYEFYKEGDAILEAGTYLALWRKVDGKLKVYMDIWNSNGQ